MSPLFFVPEETLTTGLYVWFWISTLLLAALLFRPVQKVIVVGRIRKLERTLKRASTPEEKEAIRKKAIPLVAVIVITFSYIFNKILIGRFYINR